MCFVDQCEPIPVKVHMDEKASAWGEGTIEWMDELTLEKEFFSASSVNEKSHIAWKSWCWVTCKLKVSKLLMLMLLA